MTSTTISYSNVAVLRPGSFIDAHGREVQLQASDLEQISRSLDPGWYQPVLTIDHAEDGPALGVVSALRWDGSYLYADFDGVEAELAAQLDAGRYPYRSAELVRDLRDGGWRLRAVSLLGARAPAVKGLPPLPRGQPAVPLALSATIYIDQIRLAAMAEPQEKEAMQHTASNPVESPDTIHLAEENQRLAQENLRLKEERVRSEVGLFLSELRGKGQLTPALEQTGIEEALIGAELGAYHFQVPSGETVNFGGLLRELLSSLPINAPPGVFPFEERKQLPRLSEQELSIAEQLGLSTEEYASIKAERG